MKNIISILCLFIAQSTIAQIQWQEISTPTTKDLNAIQFVSGDLGFVCGDSVLLKTMDGGITWSLMSLDSFPNNINQSVDFLDMHWFDELNGYVIAGPWGGFYQTIDGGLDWEPVTTANSGFCQSSSLYFFDENNGFAGGAGCFEGHIIDRFSNGTWSTTTDPQDWDTGNWITSIEFRDSNLGFAGTKRGTLLRTIDGGLNWDTIPSMAEDSTITDFAFYGADTVRATHRNNNNWGAMLSIDGGETWTWDSETATFFYPSMNAVHINGNGVSFMGGVSSGAELGMIFDNSEGTFWSWGQVEQEVNDIASHTDSITFLAADSGVIYVNVVPSTIGIQEQNELSFQLAQNPTTDRIQLSGFEEPIMAISILDIAGKVLQQENGRFGQGIEIEVSDLPQGTYLIQVQSEKGVGVRRFVKL